MSNSIFKIGANVLAINTGKKVVFKKNVRYEIQAIKNPCCDKSLLIELNITGENTVCSGCHRNLGGEYYDSSLFKIDSK